MLTQGCFGENQIGVFVRSCGESGGSGAPRMEHARVSAPLQSAHSRC